ncbi:AAA family ATPase [Desulfovibrio psychrotolerans]|uniref:Transposase n=1 Tax=Desulfovibrio psychrotolerans TaxID=415242 RepID=A0A7J0BW77_9BACT|nr:ATP-binding protein [Desulfovibrio psychrotolerans]GFM37969.1 transposase [Desulfovibrio psychrotolerans]
MMQNDSPVNTPLAGRIANLSNVSMCLGSFAKAINRESHLPGLLVMHGPSGYGKTTAATSASMMFDAYYVQCRSSWTRKAFYLALLKVMNIDPARTIYAMEEQIVAQLALSRLPVIIDEADHLTDRGIIECVRDIYEGSGAAILLIGEEKLPGALARWERIHNRVLEWLPAQPATLADARALADLYCRSVRVADDLLELIHTASKGVARRICVNLERVQETGRTMGHPQMGLAEWGDTPLYTGDAPSRRR